MTFSPSLFFEQGPADEFSLLKTEITAVCHPHGSRKLHSKHQKILLFL